MVKSFVGYPSGTVEKPETGVHQLAGAVFPKI
jgi:hypothetical protein